MWWMWWMWAAFVWMVATAFAWHLAWLARREVRYYRERLIELDGRCIEAENDCYELSVTLRSYGIETTESLKWIDKMEVQPMT